MGIITPPCPLRVTYALLSSTEKNSNISPIHIKHLDTTIVNVAHKQMPISICCDSARFHRGGRPQDITGEAPFFCPCFHVVGEHSSAVVVTRHQKLPVCFTLRDAKHARKIIFLWNVQNCTWARTIHFVIEARDLERG